MSTIRTNAILDAAGGNTATINGAYIRPGVLDPENRIINGAFDFWQRGTSFSTNAYGADRWVNNLAGGTVTMSRQPFTIGDTLGSNSPSFFLRQVVSGQTLASHYATVQHRIEGVRSYAGQAITILGWARRSSGSGNMAVDFAQNFGTGGSPSPTAFSAGQTVSLTGSWAPFALSFAIPSITGRTLGTDNNDFLVFNLSTSAGSDFNARTNSLGLQTIGVDLWGIHIKVGTHTTAAVDLYRQPEFQQELARCQRYYEKSFSLSQAPIQNSGSIPGLAFFAQTVGASTSVALGLVRFSVTKRAVPSVALFNVNSANAQVRNTSTGADCSASAVASVGETSFGVSVTTAVGSSVGGTNQVHWVAEAEL